MRYGGIKIPGEGNQVRDHISGYWLRLILITDRISINILGGCIVIIRPPAKEPSEMKLLNQNDLFLLKGTFFSLQNNFHVLIPWRCYLSIYINIL
jgi:hypothetical protein